VTIVRLGALGLLALLGWTGSAAAQEQELELDLSEPKPKVPQALKPSIAILGVSPADDDGMSAERAEALEAELHTLLTQSEDYSSVLSPSGLKDRLGETAERAAGCADYACFDETARALGVNRAVRLTVEHSENGSLVTLYGYDPGFSAIVTVTQESNEGSARHAKSRNQRDREFVEQLTPFLRGWLAKLATPNGTIAVRCSDPGAAVTLDGAPGGLGSTELIAQRGLHTVRVSSAGALPFEAQVAVVSMETVKLDVRLDPKPPEAPAPLPLIPVPVVRRPGLYLGGAGLVLAVVGLVLGQVASSVATKIGAGGNPIGVTRAQAKSAALDATLANVFVPLGLAATAGGTVWFLLQPPQPSASAAKGAETP